MKLVRIHKTQSPSSIMHVKYCDSFGDRLLGLMFSKELKPDHGLLLVNKSESKADASIHMFFMNYDITVLWLDAHLVIVDKALAKKWHPFYGPSEPAKYILELHHSQFAEYSIGDKLVLLDGQDLFA